MKKIFALIVCLSLSCIFMFGCSVGDLFNCGGQTVAPIVSAKPWQNESDFEQVTYTLERYGGFAESNLGDGENTEIGDGIVEATGTYTTTIETVSGNIYTSDVFQTLKSDDAFDGYFNTVFGGDDKPLSAVPDTYTLFTDEYVLNYNEKSEHEGKTDKMRSVVLLKTSSLLPVFSVKIVDMQSAPENSYRTLTDYLNGVNRLVYTDTEEKTVENEVKTNVECYDQNSLSLVIRAHSTLSTVDGSANLQMHNAVQHGLNNQKTRNITFHSSYSVMGGFDEDANFLGRYTDADYYAEDEYKKADGEITEDKDGNKVDKNGDKVDGDGYVLNDDGERVIAHHKGYELPVYAVIYQVNETNHGPTKSFVYSAAGFEDIGSTTVKVLLSFTETDADNDGNATFVTVGKISGYTMEKN